MNIFLTLLKNDNGLIRKIRLIPKFMTSQTEQQIIQYTYCPITQEAKTFRQ